MTGPARLGERLDKGQVASGIVLRSPDVAVAELVGVIGSDFASTDIGADVVNVPQRVAG